MNNTNIPDFEATYIVLKLHYFYLQAAMQDMKQVQNTICHPVFRYNFHPARMNQVVPVEIPDPSMRKNKEELRKPRGPNSGPATPVSAAKGSKTLDIRKIRRQNCPQAREDHRRARAAQPSGGVRVRILAERKWSKALMEHAPNDEARGKLLERVKFLENAADGKKGARQQWLLEQERKKTEGRAEQTGLGKFRTA